MSRLVTATALTLALGIALLYWAVLQSSVGPAQTVAIGMVELAAVVAMVDVGWRNFGAGFGGFNGRPPAF
jgi:hypothetical protein